MRLSGHEDKGKNKFAGAGTCYYAEINMKASYRSEHSEFSFRYFV